MMTSDEQARDDEPAGPITSVGSIPSAGSGEDRAAAGDGTPALAGQGVLLGMAAFQVDLASVFLQGWLEFLRSAGAQYLDALAWLAALAGNVARTASAPAASGAAVGYRSPERVEPRAM